MQANNSIIEEKVFYVGSSLLALRLLCRVGELLYSILHCQLVLIQDCKASLSCKLSEIRLRWSAYVQHWLTITLLKKNFLCWHISNSWGSFAWLVSCLYCILHCQLGLIQDCKLNGTLFWRNLREFSMWKRITLIKGALPTVKPFFFF